MQHHLHVRKRARQPVEPYPSKIFRIAVLDVAVYVVSIAGPIFTVPQIVDIYIGKDASGVSLITWGAYTLFSIPWIMYGFVHKERVLIVNNTLWLIANGLVVVGALMY
jgi:uncharacterized protein with PQ loop repeat